MSSKGVESRHISIIRSLDRIEPLPREIYQLIRSIKRFYHNAQLPQFGQPRIECLLAAIEDLKREALIIRDANIPVTTIPGAWSENENKST